MPYLLFFAFLAFSAKTLLGWKLALIFAGASLVLFFPARPAAYVIMLFSSAYFIRKKPELKFKVNYLGSYILLGLLFVWFSRRFNYLLTLPSLLGLALIAWYQYKDSKETALALPDENDFNEDQ